MLPGVRWGGGAPLGDERQDLQPLASKWYASKGRIRPPARQLTPPPLAFRPALFFLSPCGTICPQSSDWGRYMHWATPRQCVRPLLVPSFSSSFSIPYPHLVHPSSVSMYIQKNPAPPPRLKKELAAQNEHFPRTHTHADTGKCGRGYPWGGDGPEVAGQGREAKVGQGLRRLPIPGQAVTRECGERENEREGERERERQREGGENEGEKK